MDLGLNGRWALVCAASKGLGRGCAEALVGEGVNVVITARGEADLLAAADALRALNRAVEVRSVAGDIATAQGRAAALAACPQVDILINNAGGPPPGDFRDWEREQWIAALEANMLAPVLLIRAFLPGMRARKFGRIVNITSAMVKSPRPHMALSTTARTGLTAFSKAMSLESAVDNVTINNLLPERIDTPRQKFMAERMMKQHGIDMTEARRRITETVAARRFGTPTEFGDACAYLCSAQAGFISGQNLQLDGGSYHGLI
jgi:3-oxoacyl-[acyl-carrier protein] reductase